MEGQTCIHPGNDVSQYQLTDCYNVVVRHTLLPVSKMFAHKMYNILAQCCRFQTLYSAVLNDVFERRSHVEGTQEGMRVA